MQTVIFQPFASLCIFCFPLWRRERDCLRRSLSRVASNQRMSVRFAHFHFRFFASLKQAWRGYKTKMPANAGHSLIWRRERDSNPRRLSPQRFSRPPHSTALPSLRRKCKGYILPSKILTVQSTPFF